MHPTRHKILNNFVYFLNNVLSIKCFVALKIYSKEFVFTHVSLKDVHDLLTFRVGSESVSTSYPQRRRLKVVQYRILLDDNVQPVSFHYELHVVLVFYSLLFLTRVFCFVFA